MNSITKDPLGEKTIDFAVRIINLSKFLISEKKEFIISKQIVRSGTNPGAMVREAKNAESGLDFVHKLGIAQKETGETQYWLEILMRTDYISRTEYESLFDDSTQIMKMLRSSILTKKNNMGKRIIPILVGICGSAYYYLS
ncbi:four helix bundle protein [Lacihabitans sp. CCS-44]|uniref:four helix bundle protein n=1 Tax=Lacihabitans sp. CCS-44 TaxID=2487331 RepID=UPI0020CF6390|nr:four helix bundle protein [Lacihabitans sp. CCS-44]MCP9757358.1 four helix bundle protein [Lacihabitans sp. CCS-44]